jgi:hypothetical protein
MKEGGSRIAGERLIEANITQRLKSKRENSLLTARTLVVTHSFGKVRRMNGAPRFVVIDFHAGAEARSFSRT